MLLFRRIVPVCVIFLYTVYSFSYAAGNEQTDYQVILIFSFLASLALFINRQHVFSKTVIGLYLFFLGLSTISIIIPFSEYANTGWLIQSIALLLLCSPIAGCFASHDEEDRPIYKWGLLASLLTLSLLAILHQLGTPIKEAFPEFAGFRPVSHDWNQKYYSFWLLFLLWGTVSFYWGKNILGIASTLALIALAAVAIFTGYSDSAKAAFIVSTMIFGLMHIKTNRWLLLWQLLIAIYILALPLIWNLLPSSWLASMVQLDINNIGFRLDVYNFSAGAIAERWLFGYGFGSTLSLPYPRVTGGHPHNIVFLFWLELGVLGAILLALAATKLLALINTHGQESVPAAWAVLTSGLIIFSFSFDIWLPGVVLTYCMWVAMMLLSSRSYSQKVSHS